jgi:hypothetical protein
MAGFQVLQGAPKVWHLICKDVAFKLPPHPQSTQSPLEFPPVRWIPVFPQEVT